MSGQTETKVLKLPPGIVCFPHFFTPWASDEDRKKGKEPYYSCSILIDQAGQQTAEWNAIKAEANRVALDRFGVDELKKMVEFQQFKSPFLNGDKYADKYPEQAGKVVLRLSSKVPPGVVDQMVRPITDHTKIYAGALVIVSVNAYAYPKPGATGPAAANKGVSFGLRNVQLYADGTPLGNRSRPEDDFKPLEHAATAAGNDPSALF